jgi:hypothetical protein
LVVHAWSAQGDPFIIGTAATPFKLHAEHRHHIQKPRYRVTNWPEYHRPRDTACPLFWMRRRGNARADLGEAGASGAE